MYDLQTNYPGVAYRDKNGKPAGATIASGGCCPTSVGNILRNLCGISDATTRNVCALATSSGARYNGGTDPSILLEAAQKKWGGFEYEYTTSDTKMRAHIKAGGMALAHTPGNTGGATALFSKSGHFIAMIGVDGSKVIVFDPYYYPGKWTENSVRKANVTTASVKGKVNAKYAAVARACDYYYLISKVEPTVTTTAKVNARAGAGITKRKLGTIDKGVNLIVMGETTNWIKTSVWIVRKYCTIKDNKATLTANANARAANATASDKLGTLTKGASLTVLEMTDNWVRVPVWVAKKYTK
ncbi:MAG: SH3 domain-containing protein [Eubacteriales bacterium]|nr:SH3 domain-containing protein [Eubacteriales bacterium]